MHSLDLSTNILGIYGTQRLAAGLAGNRGITKLNLANNNMCGVQTTGYGDWLAEGIKALAGAFAVRKEGDETPYNTTVTSLDLSNNGFGPLGGVEFARVLTPSEEDGRANSSLVHLDLSNNRLAAAGGVALARALRPDVHGNYNTSLRRLNLEGNNMGELRKNEGAAVALVEALACDERGLVNRTLRELNVLGNHFSFSGIEALIAGDLEGAQKLLKGPRRSPEAAQGTAPSAWGSTSSGSAGNVSDGDGELGVSQIGIEGAAAIGAAFAQGRTIRKDVMMGSVRERAPPMALESLILRDNSLSPAAACQITAALTGSTGSDPHPLKGGGRDCTCGTALTHNDTLETLCFLEAKDAEARMIDCNLHSEDAALIAAEVVEKSELTNLDLTRNLVMPQGLGALGEMLMPLPALAEGAYTSTLTSLVLSKNRVSVRGLLAIASALRINSTLTYLNLSRNLIGPAGAAALASGLAHNSRLQVLDLSNNDLVDEGANSDGIQALAEAVARPLPKSMAAIALEVPVSKTYNTSLETLRVRTVELRLGALRRSEIACLDLRNSNVGAEDLHCRSSLRVIQLNEMEIPLYDLHTNVLQELAFPKLCAEDASLIASVLERNTSLDRLTVRGVCMPVGLLTCSGAGPGGVAPLTALHLPRSSLGQEHLILLGHLLMRNSLLTELDLSGNFVAGRERDVELERLEGIEVLANMLKLLDLSENMLGGRKQEEAAAGLARMIASNSALESLIMGHNKWTFTEVEIISEA
eukprot:gene27670-34154_t